MADVIGEDTGFNLLPNDGTVLDADEALERALGAPGITPDDAEGNISGGPLPFGRAWAFDFEKGQMGMRGLAPAELRGVDALKVWIETTLRTARYAHIVFSDDYGLDTVELIGRPFSPGIAQQYADAVKDALKVHDRIQDVKDFRFTGSIDSDALLISFRVVVESQGEEIDINVGPTAVVGTELVVDDPTAQVAGGF